MAHFNVRMGKKKYNTMSIVLIILSFCEIMEVDIIRHLYTVGETAVNLTADDDMNVRFRNGKRYIQKKYNI